MPSNQVDVQLRLKDLKAPYLMEIHLIMRNRTMSYTYFHIML